MSGNLAEAASAWFGSPNSGRRSSPPKSRQKLPLSQDIDIDEFRKEAKVWVAAGGHPNVLPLITADIFSGQVVIASQYASEGTLSGWLEKHGCRAPSFDTAIQMITGVLKGLRHLHSKDIVHRDLKPANVLLQGGGQEPLIADFGLARVLRTDSSTLRLAGTPAYMAPEVWLRNDRCFQADLWAVGVLLYEMLSGNKPFKGGNRAQLERAVKEDSPEPLPAAVSQPLRLIVEKALQKDKRKRFQSAEEMLQALAPNLAAAELHHKAVYCLRGIGTQRDGKAAVELLKIAAQRGCAESMYELSNQYAQGDYIPVNEEQALFWCRKAADAGHSFAMISLGQFYVYGIMGCDQD